MTPQSRERGADGATIRAVTFDLDDTLFDFQGCVARAGAEVIRALCERHPAATGRTTLERFHALWHRATEESLREEDVPVWSAVRRRGIQLLLQESDCSGADLLVDELTALYFHHRRLPTDPFEDAAAMLVCLAGRVPLGIITNGNGQLTQVGLTEHFRIIVTPAVAGCSKPAPDIFLHAAAALGCAPAELLHVGDHWENDVVGALRAGCLAAWYCRDTRSAPDGAVPHLVVRDHRELVPWILARCAGTTAVDATVGTVSQNENRDSTRDRGIPRARSEQ